MPLPRIRILATGGTIAGAAGSPALAGVYRAAELQVEALCQSVPGLERVARIETETVAAIDSKNATPVFWRALATRVQAALDEPGVDGVVATHGTDTMEESAYYLHLVLKSSKPVVMVGAMRPSTSLSADGPLNLLNAVRVAAAPDSAGRGVLVAMDNAIHGARAATKVDTVRAGSFASPLAGPLGLIQDEQVVWLSRAERAHTVNTPFDTECPLAPVELLFAYAGTPASLIGAVLAGRPAGLVWAGAGHGSVSAEAALPLADAAAQGVAIVRASRTGGVVLPRADDVEQGFIAAGTLSPYKARILAMLALGAGWQAERLREAFARY